MKTACLSQAFEETGGASISGKKIAGKKIRNSYIGKVAGVGPASTIPPLIEGKVGIQSGVKGGSSDNINWDERRR